MSRDLYETYDSYKWITCPRCGGSGKDNDTLDHNCFECHGSGQLHIKKSVEKEIRDRFSWCY